MANYEEAKVKVTNTQPNKLKSAVKNKTGTTLRITKKNFEDEELPHELFLKTRRKTKTRNAFTENKSTDIKLSKAQISKITESEGIFSNMMSDLANGFGNLGKEVMKNLVVPLAKDVLPGLVRNMASNVNSNAIGKLGRKISGQGAVLPILNEDMDGIIKIKE